jgi:cold shock protein
MSKSNGTVKWFSQEKGYGFITGEDGKDVFVHHTSIQGQGFRTLDDGERVEFEIVEEPRGVKAVNVVRLDAQAGGADAGAEGGGEERRGGYGGSGYGGYDDRG